MEITLESTNASRIASALVRARRAAGSPAMDMVLTLIVVTDDETVGADLATANELAHEHPARIIGVVHGDGRGAPRLDAKVRVGVKSSGESLLLRVSGGLTNHAESVVLPLLLPDTPVVVWWPHSAPAEPALDPIGRLAQRRLTDSESTRQPVRALKKYAAHFQPGDTDLAWTRLTPWRAILAAALDQLPEPEVEVTAGSVSATAGNPAAVLLAAWLSDRLGLDIEFKRGEGDQISRVELITNQGPVVIERIDEQQCSFSVPGTKSRLVPLGRRSLAELLAEDLRRLDNDDIYAETIAHLLETT